MKRSTLKPKLVLATVFVILALSLTVAPVQAWGRYRKYSRVYYRSIEDWLQNNIYGTPRGYGGYDRDGSVKNIYFEPLLDSDYKYWGYVREEVMCDGTLKYSVSLLAMNIDIQVYNGFIDDEGNVFDEDILLIGRMTYVFEISFIMEPTYPGGETWWGEVPPGERGPGDEIPYLFFMIYFQSEVGGRITSLEILGFGQGKLMEPDWYAGDPEPPVPTGEYAMVYLHQQAIFYEDGTFAFPYEEVIVY